MGKANNLYCYSLLGSEWDDFRQDLSISIARKADMDVTELSIESATEPFLTGLQIQGLTFNERKDSVILEYSLISLRSDPEFLGSRFMPLGKTKLLNPRDKRELVMLGRQYKDQKTVLPLTKSDTVK
jgi:hypothetical protein